MNLQPYFEAQKKLDEHIIQEKGLQGQDLLDKKILALQVELGELAQNWRGFKFWSNDQEPRTYKSVPVSCKKCGGTGVFFIGSDYDCDLCNGHGEVEKDSNPLLEEYVDCLHFILSIGNDIGYTGFNECEMREYLAVVGQDELTREFIGIYWLIADLIDGECVYEQVLYNIINLGEMLGFSEQQIHDAYFDKNATNHKRQETGY